MLSILRQRRRPLGRSVVGLLLCSWLALHCQHCLAALADAVAPVAAAETPGCQHDVPADDRSSEGPCDCGVQVFVAGKSDGPDFAGTATDAGFLAMFATVPTPVGRAPAAVPAPVPPAGHPPPPRNRYPLLLN